MKTSVLLSEHEQWYYRNSINKILNFLKENGPSDAGNILIHRRSIGIAWQLHTKTKMLQLLRTLSQKGCVERVDKGINFTDWKFIKEIDS